MQDHRYSAKKKFIYIYISGETNGIMKMSTHANYTCQEWSQSKRQSDKTWKCNAEGHSRKNLKKVNEFTNITFQHLLWQHERYTKHSCSGIMRGLMELKWIKKLFFRIYFLKAEICYVGLKLSFSKTERGHCGSFYTCWANMPFLAFQQNKI